MCVELIYTIGKNSRGMFNLRGRSRSNYEGVEFKCSRCSAPTGHGVGDRSLETLDRTWIMAGVATEPSPPNPSVLVRGCTITGIAVSG